MKAKPIKEILLDYLKGNSFNKINETINLEIFWEKIVGKTISKNTEIINLKNGTVTVKTSNPIWRNELFLQKQDLLKKIKEAQTELKIKDIIFR